jgi:hypothetical protein
MKDQEEIRFLTYPFNIAANFSFSTGAHSSSPFMMILFASALETVNINFRYLARIS